MNLAQNNSSQRTGRDRHRSFIKLSPSPSSSLPPPLYSCTIAKEHHAQITTPANQKITPFIKSNPFAILASSFPDDSDAYEASQDDQEVVKPILPRKRPLFKLSEPSRSIAEEISPPVPVKPGHSNLRDSPNTHLQPRPQPASSSSSTFTKPRRKILKTSSSSIEPGSGASLSLVFTPADRDSASGASGPTSSATSSRFLARKSASSPTLCDIRQSPPPYSPPELDSHYLTTMPHNSSQEGPTQVSSSSSSHSFASWSQARSRPHSRVQSRLPSPKNSDTEDDRDPGEEGSDNDVIYTSRLSSLHPSSASWRTANGITSRHATGSSQSLRSRIFALASGGGARDRARESDRGDKVICTTPGVGCAGETETETDEPSRHLPTARIIHNKDPLGRKTFQEWLTPLLFKFSCLLSIVPALVGTVYNVYHLLYPPSRDGWSQSSQSRAPPDRLDFFVAALWSILTGYQCLCITTGLLTRWRLYYRPLSTLVRLLALQGICWPATQLTVAVLEHAKRPAITWAVIGTTTCCSRSVQLWVTSNLWWERRNSVTPGGDNIPGNGDDLQEGSGATAGATSSSLSSHLHHLSHLAGGRSPAPSNIAAAVSEENRRGYWKRFRGGKWGGRRWDWTEVGLKCVLPAGLLYFVMALVGEVRRDFLDVAISSAGC